MDHVRLCVDGQDRFVLFGLCRTAEHLERSIAKDEPRLDEQTLASPIEEDRPVGVARDESIGPLCDRKPSRRRDSRPLLDRRRTVDSEVPDSPPGGPPGRPRK